MKRDKIKKKKNEKRKKRKKEISEKKKKKKNRTKSVGKKAYSMNVIHTQLVTILITCTVSKIHLNKIKIISHIIEMVMC